MEPTIRAPVAPLSQEESRNLGQLVVSQANQVQNTASDTNKKISIYTMASGITSALSLGHCNSFSREIQNALLNNRDVQDRYAPRSSFFSGPYSYYSRPDPIAEAFPFMFTLGMYPLGKAIGNVWTASNDLRKACKNALVVANVKENPESDDKLKSIRNATGLAGRIAQRSLHSAQIDLTIKFFFVVSIFAAIGSAHQCIVFRGDCPVAAEIFSKAAFTAVVFLVMNVVASGINATYNANRHDALRMQTELKNVGF